ncbi:MAG: hypothetical protein KJZ86_00615 [Caldilineaceae bacterium]|nr:hypothetical protein [Caldilineaceae bacterium]HRJ40290.1 ATP-binding protein [Caldilineaceae bacterium]
MFAQTRERLTSHSVVAARNGNGGVLMANPSVLHNPDHYDPDWFVNRKDEIRIVKELVGRLRSGGDAPERTISFDGARGQGKSWLAQHLHRTIFPKLNVKSLYFAFDSSLEEDPENQGWYLHTWQTKPERTDLNQGMTSAFAADILLDSCIKLEARHTIDANLAERAAELVAPIRREAERESTGRQLYAFILDSVSELSSSFTDILERALLASVASFPNVLIVMTGRPPFPVWAAPRLRIDVIHWVLKPFCEQDVLSMLSRRNSDNQISLEQVMKKSHGIPGVVRDISLQSGGATKVSLSATLNWMLDVFANPQDRQRAREGIEALCLLKHGFREEEIQKMLSAYSEKEITEEDVEALEDLLTKQQLLKWDRESAGLQVDRAIRLVAAQYLYDEQPKLWTRLHEEAAGMYEEYAAQFRDHRDYYQRIAEHHRQALNNEHSSVDADIQTV